VTIKRVTNVAASVRQRLKNVAGETGRPFAEVLQWYAIERFLARFANTPHASQYIVKGAAVLRTLMVEPARPTMDILSLRYTTGAHQRGCRQRGEARSMESLPAPHEPAGPRPRSFRGGTSHQ
jgi:hypothetical protein